MTVWFWVVLAAYVVLLAAVGWWLYLKRVFVCGAEEGLRDRERWKAEHPDITEPNRVSITGDSGVTPGRAVRICPSTGLPLGFRAAHPKCEYPDCLCPVGQGATS